MFLPEYAIWVSPNIIGVNIHAFGKDSSNNLDAIMHAVVDEYVAVQCKAQNVVSGSSAARITDLYSQTVKHSGYAYTVRRILWVNDYIAMPLTMSDSGQHYCCWSYKHIGVQPLKGHYPNVGDSKHCFAIDDKTNCLFATKNGMLLVIGLTDTSYNHSLLLRSNCTWDTKLVSKNLRLDVLSKITWNKGLEVNRKGGSSSCARVTGTFITFQNSDLLPRDASGVKFIKNKRLEGFLCKAFWFILVCSFLHIRLTRWWRKSLWAIQAGCKV